MKLRPFDEVIESAEQYRACGATVHQRFQCEACKDDTLGIEEPNTFHTKGHCDRCGHITDLEKTGCNFLVILSA
jgi:hypothetical protein